MPFLWGFKLYCKFVRKITAVRVLYCGSARNEIELQSQSFHLCVGVQMYNPASACNNFMVVKNFENTRFLNMQQYATVKII